MKGNIGKLALLVIILVAFGTEVDFYPTIGDRINLSTQPQLHERR